MEEYVIPLQSYLAKKDKECGELKCLNSRATSENNANIDEICTKIDEILRSCKVPTQENTSIGDPRCASAFKCLLLNTNFDSQEKLTEDLLHGHIVDIFCPMSPYLLIEILFFLWYEEIVAESILHVPLDLAVELMDILKRFLHNLDFDRSLNLLSLLLLNSYKRLHIIAKEGALTTNMDVSLQKLMIHCQELMNFFFEDSIIKLSEVKKLKKSERIGHVIQKMLKVTGECLKCGKSDIELSSEMRNLYKLTYGSESNKQASEHFHSQLRIFDQMFVDDMWHEMTTFSVGTFIDWASLEDPKRMMTLQQSIRIDSYLLMDFVNKCDNVEPQKLLQILKVMHPLKPDTETPASDLKQLISNLDGKESATLKELMKRYREWNDDTFKAVIKHASLMDKEDFANLLEFYAHLMSKEGQEDYKRRVYTTLIRTLMNQDVKSLYEIVLNYILKHNAGNSLESPNTEESFKAFMLHNKNFKSAPNLRVVLIFMLKNPEKILSILVKMSIGHSEYENVMVSPNDLTLLSPIMTARLTPNRTLLLSSLASITIENKNWKAHKWNEFVLVMFENSIFTKEQFIDTVLLPFLENDSNYPLSKVSIILKNLWELSSNYTKRSNYTKEVNTRLITGLTQKLTTLRRDRQVSRVWLNETVSCALRIYSLIRSKFLQAHEEWVDSMFIRTLKRSITPIDEYYTSRFWSRMAYMDVFPDNSFILKLYERRCSTVLAKIRHQQQLDEAEMNDVFQVEDYIRHLFTTSVEKEYVHFGVRFVLCDWSDNNYANEYEAYDKIVHLTVETCAFALEFPTLNPSDQFACLLKNLALFTRKIANSEKLKKVKELDKSLLENLRKLNESIEETPYSSLYVNFFCQANNRVTTDLAHENLDTLVALISNFADECLEVCHQPFEGKSSDRLKRYKITHEFISEITSLDNADENLSSLLEVYHFLYS